MSGAISKEKKHLPLSKTRSLTSKKIIFNELFLFKNDTDGESSH